MLSLAGLAVSATGCGTNASESIGSSRLAFTVESCASADADQIFTGKLDPAFVTPRSYNTCYKGYVVDIENLAPTYTGSGNAMDANIAVQWADTPITSQTACENTRVVAVFYEGSVAGASSVNTSGTTGYYNVYNWVPLKTEEQYGVWVAPFGAGSCGLEVNLTDLVPGNTYRVAATARTPGNSTRKVSIGTYKPVDVK
jgi:hypothetical protein